MLQRDSKIASDQLPMRRQRVYKSTYRRQHEYIYTHWPLYRKAFTLNVNYAITFKCKKPTTWYKYIITLFSITRTPSRRTLWYSREWIHQRLLFIVRSHKITGWHRIITWLYKILSIFTHIIIYFRLCSLWSLYVTFLKEVKVTNVEKRN